jgi:hypothetical protein
MGTGPVDPNQGSGTTQHTDNQDPNYDFDAGYQPTQGSTPPRGTQTKAYGTGGTGYTPTKSYSSSPTSSGGISSGGDFGLPGQGSDPEVGQFVQDLKGQGYSSEQIQQAVYEQFGVQLTNYDLDYYLNGNTNRDDRGGNKYYGYPTSPMAKQYGYGSPTYLQNYLQQNQMYQDAKENARQTKSHGRQEMVRMNMILLLILMGDVTGALRAYTSMMDRDFRTFARQVMNKLGKVRQARARVIRNFANNKPPKAYAGDNPQSAARAQDQAQRYTQYVQLSTQLMGELQSTERELVDTLQTMKRDIDNFWQSYASMRDAEGRVNERLMTTR